MARTSGSQSIGEHRQVDPALSGDFSGDLVASIGMAHHAGAGIGGENAVQSLVGQVGAVGNYDHARVDRAADTNAAAMMNTYP